MEIIVAELHGILNVQEAVCYCDSKEVIRLALDNREVTDDMRFPLINHIT